MAPRLMPRTPIRRGSTEGCSLSQVTTGSYIKFTPAIPVKVQGSLFYDIDHEPGVIGPTGFRPKTAWEIHPVTDIEFEP